MKQGKNEQSFIKKKYAGHSKYTFPTTPDIHEYHQMINTEIILIMIFAARDREVLYSQQKQDLEPTVTQIMSSYYKIQV